MRTTYLRVIPDSNGYMIQGMVLESLRLGEYPSDFKYVLGFHTRDEAVLEMQNMVNMNPSYRYWNTVAQQILEDSIVMDVEAMDH